MRRVRTSLFALVCLAALGGCPPKYPRCDGDKDCRAKEFCVNGQCQQCRTDSDCPNGGSCKAGRCEAAVARQSCSDDAQCPSGQSCIAGVCRPCTSDSQCGENGKCNAGRCARNVTGENNPPIQGCTLQPIYFDFNEYSLTTEGTTAIDNDADCLKRNAAHGASLTGHTDPRGTEEYNLALSDRRAQAVKERLSRLGVAGNLKTVAKGELEATGKDEAGWAHDRRVDVQ